MRPAYATAAGDVFCDQCGRQQDRADEKLLSRLIIGGALMEPRKFIEMQS